MGTFTPSGQQGTIHSSIKAGVYPCEVVGAKAKISKDGNFEQHSLRVRVYDEKNDDWEDFWDLLTFSERAQWKLEEAMLSLGIGFQVGLPCMSTRRTGSGRRAPSCSRKKLKTASAGCASTNGFPGSKWLRRPRPPRRAPPPLGKQSVFHFRRAQDRCSQAGAAAA